MDDMKTIQNMYESWLEVEQFVQGNISSFSFCQKAVSVEYSPSNFKMEEMNVIHSHMVTT